MNFSILDIFRYCLSPEDSRLGVQNDWCRAFLRKRTHGQRFFLETSKVIFIISLSLYLCSAMGKIL